MLRVFADLAQQSWTYVSTSMKRHCCSSSVRMTIEPVRSLAGAAFKSKRQQNPFDLGSSENRDTGAHRHATINEVVAMNSLSGTKASCDCRSSITSARLTRTSSIVSP